MLAVMSPEFADFDPAVVDTTIELFSDRKEFAIPSGFGLQAYIGAQIFMRVPDSIINVIIVPDKNAIQAWWLNAPQKNRLKFVPIRNKSKLAITTAVLQKATETLCFCEFDEHLIESDKNQENSEPWRAARISRRNRLPLATKILKPASLSSGITQDLFLRD